MPQIAKAKVLATQAPDLLMIEHEVRRLCAQAISADLQSMCVVVESGGDSFCLIVDSVGDVISIKTSEIEPNPGSLQASWAQMSRGVYRTNDHLLLLLDIDQLLAF